MMKLSCLFFTMLVASAPAYSAVDYSYCQQQFNQYIKPNKPCKSANGIASCFEQGGKKTADSSYYPFELTEDGKVKAHPTLNFKATDGKEVISIKSKEMDYQTVVVRNEKGEISEIKTIYSMNANWASGFYGNSANGNSANGNSLGLPRSNESTVKMEIKNGKCIPTRMDTVNTIGDESRQEVTFDANLCRNVGQFFKKNPEAASCFDKDLMSKAENIFSKYYKENTDLYGEAAQNNTFGKPRTLKTKYKSDAKNGIGKGFYGYPGSGVNGGAGVGVGIGMPGATSEQMLAVTGPTIDSIIGTSSPYLAGLNGFGISPVVQAIQLNALCQASGWNYATGEFTRGFLNDESVWKEEASQTKSSSTVDK